MCFQMVSLREKKVLPLEFHGRNFSWHDPRLFATTVASIESLKMELRETPLLLSLKNNAPRAVVDALLAAWPEAVHEKDRMGNSSLHRLVNSYHADWYFDSTTTKQI